MLISISHTFQVKAQESVNTAGGNSFGISGSVSYSIGQFAFSNVIGSNGTADEGVQQPFDIYPLNIGSKPNIGLTMGVYPNPTSSFIVLSLDQILVNKLVFQLYDYAGRLLDTKQIKETKTIIQMGYLPSGTYMLSVKDAITIFQSFKIIKNN